jgi:lipopolysaccharide exporter
MSRQIAIGALWMLLSKVFERSISVCSTLILARLLVPEDFGIVAIGTAVAAFIELFKSLGMEAALIQRQDASPEHYHTAWTLNVLAGLAIGGLIAAVAMPAATFYKDERLLLVLLVLGASAALQGFENIGVVDFRKKMQFNRDFWYLSLQKVMGFALVIPLAFALRSYLALVFGILGTRFLVLIQSYLAHSFRPRFSVAALGDLLHFSKWMIPLSVLNFAKDRAADFILGRTAGPHSLGLFSISYQIATMPSTELVAPINRALLPAYSAMQADRSALARQYVATMSFIAVLAVPAVVGLAATASLVVAVLLGEKWAAAAPVVTLLAFYGITQVLVSNSGAALMALGKVRQIVWMNTFHVVLLISALLLLTPGHGAIGAAGAIVTAGLISLPVSLVLIVRHVGLRLQDLLGVIWRPLIASIIMYFSMEVLRPAAGWTYTSSAGALPALAVEVLGGALVYVTSLYILWILSGRPLGAEQWVLGYLQRRLER